MFKHIHRYLLLSLCVTFLHAEENVDLLASITQDIQHFEKVATQTHNNELYQPYILSVFQGKELEILGVSTLEEALSLVPGVDIATDNFNYRTPIFRGSNSAAYGQSKLFIDGVVVNDLFFDGYSAYLSMPIDMIKRIEVVRGPGSQNEGVNAYAGSIHVITYAEVLDTDNPVNKVLIKAGSDDYMMAASVFNYKEDDFHLYVDLSYQSDDKNILAGPDAAAENILGAPNAHLAQTDDAPLWLKSFNLGMTLNYGAFTFKGRILEHTQGSAYGINYLLPQHSDRLKLPNRYAELTFEDRVGKVDLKIQAGIHTDSFDSRAHLIPDGLVFPSLTPPTTLVVYPEGFYGIHDAKQQSLYHNFYLKYSEVENHAFTLGYRYVNDTTTSVTTRTTDRDSGVGLTDYTQTYPFFDSDAKRETFTVFLQDHFDISDALSIIYGINIEKSTQSPMQYNPRISFVYQPDAKNIFKAMYSKSHRNPSWQEMYTLNNRARVGNTDLDPEQVDALEMAYIYKFSTSDYVQGNLFYLNNKDQINNINPTYHYQNADNSVIYGAELELKTHLSFSDQLYLNYSYVTGESDIDDALANVATHMAKGYYLYHFTPEFTLSALGRYVGSKERMFNDTRDALKEYVSVDTAFSYHSYDSGLRFTAALKNVFDADISYPAPPLTYSNDYPQAGRSFVITLEKSF
jgi:iron complex outermembrane receptor protein